mmetsp:Transcript_40434/g.120632  ORF Transcript_40434/g.120632 Transcript_40434/m.120632 type:complete len:256 (-) Transcript_40434:1082-1849(-)|eukprot:365431-Chlamydomonas_euryale.AAC.15
MGAARLWACSCAGTPPIGALSWRASSASAWLSVCRSVAAGAPKCGAAQPMPGMYVRWLAAGAELRAPPALLHDGADDMRASGSALNVNSGRPGSAGAEPADAEGAPTPERYPDRRSPGGLVLCSLTCPGSLDALLSDFIASIGSPLRRRVSGAPLAVVCTTGSRTTSQPGWPGCIHAASAAARSARSSSASVAGATVRHGAPSSPVPGIASPSGLSMLTWLCLVSYTRPRGCCCCSAPPAYQTRKRCSSSYTTRS